MAAAAATSPIGALPPALRRCRRNSTRAKRTNWAARPCQTKAPTAKAPTPLQRKKPHSHSRTIDHRSKKRRPHPGRAAPGRGGHRATAAKTNRKSRRAGPAQSFHDSSRSSGGACEPKQARQLLARPASRNSGGNLDEPASTTARQLGDEACRAEHSDRPNLASLCEAEQNAATPGNLSPRRACGTSHAPTPKSGQRRSAREAKKSIYWRGHAGPGTGEADCETDNTKQIGGQGGALTETGTRAGLTEAAAKSWRRDCGQSFVNKRTRRDEAAASRHELAVATKIRGVRPGPSLRPRPSAIPRRGSGWKSTQNSYPDAFVPGRLTWTSGLDAGGTSSAVLCQQFRCPLAGTNHGPTKRIPERKTPIPHPAGLAGFIDIPTTWGGTVLVALS